MGEAHVVRVSGTDGDTCADLDLALRTVYDDGGRRVAVDLSALEAIEPAPLEVVLRHLARFRAQGGDVVLACPGEGAIDGELRVERRVEDALASLLL